MKIRCFIIVITAIVLLFCNAVSESLLPDLEDVYGIEVPSLASVIGKKPDQVEEKGKETVHYYLNVTEEDYYDYGNVLEEAGCKVLSYTTEENTIELVISIKDKEFRIAYDIVNDSMFIFYPEGVHDSVSNELKIAESYYYEGESKRSNGDWDGAVEAFENAGDFSDAKVQIAETYYQKAMTLYNEGNYSSAIAILEIIPDYEKTPALNAEIQYKLGMGRKEKRDRIGALSYLRKAKEYPETQAAIDSIYNEWFVDYINNKRFTEINTVMQNAKEDGAEINNFVYCRPGDSGDDIQAFLSIAQKLGYIKKLDSEYKEEYKDSIIALESRLGLTSDGIVYANELVVINNTMYPGYQDSKVADVLEHLVDAGYIKGPLPDKHTEYRNEYSSAVVKAKKACGLVEDRLISNDEADVLLGLPILEVEQTSNVKVNVPPPGDFGRGTGRTYVVTISWKASKNALFYDLYQNGRCIVNNYKGTKYEIKLNSEGKYQYSVVARNYEYESEKVNAEPVWVGPPTLSIKELLENKEEFLNKNIDIVYGSLQYVEQYEMDNGSLYILLKSDGYCLYCQIKNASGLSLKGKALYCDQDSDYIDKPSMLYGKFTQNKRQSSQYGAVYVLEVKYYRFLLKNRGLFGNW